MASPGCVAATRYSDCDWFCLTIAFVSRTMGSVYSFQITRPIGEDLPSSCYNTREQGLSHARGCLWCKIRSVSLTQLSPAMEKPVKFDYSSEDLYFKCTDIASKFDVELCSKWDEAMEKGYFKYNLDSVETKIIPGKFNFVGQLNEKRFTQRRQPQLITSLSQPFNSEKFNFTKVPSKEVLLSVCPRHRDCPGRHVVIINVSPLEYGNVLFVPNADGKFPQVLTQESIEFSIELILLSNRRAFRIGFNSLCAFASVNHLHLHAFYSPHVLPVEDANVSCISGGFYETVDYPMKAFVFECCDYKSLYSVARQVHQVTSYLHQNDIAHNVFFTRGRQLQAQTLATDDNDVGLRIFIWARKATTGIKNEDVFNIAVCELGGFLPIKERSWFDTMTEEDVCNYLKESSLEEEQYMAIRNEILKNFNN